MHDPAIDAPEAAEALTAPSLEVLAEIQQRVLWLATSMVQVANARPKAAGDIKVGGHQASSASMVSIMTTLYFADLERGDRVSVKPHAAPVLHAINFLLGQLAPTDMDTLRAFGGLQSYPSRTKDPGTVDFSTGSVGIGATATIWHAISAQYLQDRFEVEHEGRSIALLGDAELDEGAVWEAVLDPKTTRLDDLMWIVDVNRQSLDRVVPGTSITRLEKMFKAAGWNTITLKHGHRLRALIEAGGEALRRRIDHMSNDEYQRILRLPAPAVRHALIGSGPSARQIETVLAELDDAEVASIVSDLGGHDLAGLLDAYQRARSTGGPSIIFAYTVKGWGLPTRGHPANHSSLLTPVQWDQLARELDMCTTSPWVAFDSTSAAGVVCRRAAERLERPRVQHHGPIAVPAEMDHPHPRHASTQQAFGRLLVDLLRSAPSVAERVVTVSPDVASSTNLGGWINKVGTWDLEERHNWFEDDADTLLQWRATRDGQHIELGIAEGNLVGLLGELGCTWSRSGQPLIPIGTVYDPFVARALEPWSFSLYSGAQSILVGTPSGVTLAPEGGAHQSITTPSIGLEQPGCVAWEPAFGQDLEWTLLAAMGDVGRPGGTSAYFRLSTRPLDQALAAMPTDPELRERRRHQVLTGGYLLRTAPGVPKATIVATGVVIAEALRAAEELAGSGIEVDVICLTSADLIFRAWSKATFHVDSGADVLGQLFPPERAAPMVTVLDGHPHTLSFLANINAVPVVSLGTDEFGRVGTITDLYRHFDIDAEAISGSVLDLLDTWESR